MAPCYAIKYDQAYHTHDEQYSTKEDKAVLSQIRANSDDDDGTDCSDSA